MRRKIICGNILRGIKEERGRGGIHRDMPECCMSVCAMVSIVLTLYKTLDSAIFSKS